jgi:hypothetical protein
MSEGLLQYALPSCPWPDGTRQVLPSGMTVVTDRVPYPVTAVATTYRVGFRDETEQTAGVAHLVEHMMGRAARKVARSGRAGTQVVAESRRDYSTVGAVAPGDLLLPAMQAGALPPTDLTIDVDDLAAEVALIEREYLDLIEARPYGLFPRFLAARHLYDSVGEGGTGYGDLEALRRLTPATVRTFIRRNYTPTRTVLTAIGPASHDQVVDAVAKHLAAWTADPALRQTRLVNPPLTRDRHMFYRRAGVPAAVALAWRLPDPAESLRAHVDLVLTAEAAFTSNGPVARWLRGTYPGVEARMWWNTFNNPWDVRTGLSLTVELAGGTIERLTDSAMALRQALPHLAEGVPSTDIDIVAAQRRLELTRSFDHPMDRARLLGIMEALFDGQSSWPDLWAALCDTRRDRAPLTRAVDGAGCLVMRCA